MSEENQSKINTKQSFREKMWLQMAKEELTHSLRSLCNRIPYFKGAAEAAQRLSELDQFKEAKLLMISPDKPQESVIIVSLQNKKEILIPRPRLLNGLFLRIKNAIGFPEVDLKNAVTRHGIKQIETPVGFDTADIKAGAIEFSIVDMLVLGSVCVNKSGYRIGDGEGFADLEYAILSKMKAVDENTIIVTTVHDCQIVDDLSNDIFEPHDVPVDIIITPTQIITINPRPKHTSEIMWSIISKRRFTAIPILNEIKKFDEREGKVTTFKEVDSDVESMTQEKIRVQNAISIIQPKMQRKRFTSDSVLKESEKSKEIRRKRFLRKRKLQKSKDNNDENNDIANKTGGTQSDSNKSKLQRQRPNLPRNQVDFSLRLSNIASTVRVRDLKIALLQRGVKPSNIIWRGQRGFCYLHFGKLRKKNVEDQPVQVDSIVANLQQLKIGETAVANENAFIVVEPAEPVTRIEVTDVSAV